jgi:hypothetical protein
MIITEIVEFRKKGCPKMPHKKVNRRRMGRCRQRLQEGHHFAVHFMAKGGHGVCWIDTAETGRTGRQPWNVRICLLPYPLNSFIDRTTGGFCSNTNLTRGLNPSAISGLGKATQPFQVPFKIHFPEQRLCFFYVGLRRDVVQRAMMAPGFL